MFELVNKKRNNLKKNKKGFTLVEVIVVLVILAILAAILVPAMIGWINKANEKTAVVEGRNVLLALQTVASDTYNPNKKTSSLKNGTLAGQSDAQLKQDMIDLTEDEGILDKVTGIEMASVAKVKKFTYINGDFTVKYDKDADKAFVVSKTSNPST